MFDMPFIVATKALLCVEIDVIFAAVGHELREVSPVVIANVRGECDDNFCWVRRSHVASRHGSIFTRFEVRDEDRPVHGHRAHRVVG